MFDIETLNKKNNEDGVLAKLECIKKIFARAASNPILAKYFDEETLTEAFRSIRICYSEEKYRKIFIEQSGLTKKQAEELTFFDIPVAFTTIESNLIYIKCDTPIEVIVHELIHRISNKPKKETGIIGIMSANLEGNDIEKKAIIDSFNEAITHYITQLLIPEAKVNDGYNYGADIIDKYSKILMECGKNPSVILDAYFFGNQKAFDSIQNDFGDYFTNIITSINYSRFLFLYQDSSKIISTEELSNIFNDIKTNIIEKNKSSFDEYVNARNMYSILEQDTINKNLNINENPEKEKHTL